VHFITERKKSKTGEFMSMVIAGGKGDGRTDEEKSGRKSYTVCGVIGGETNSTNGTTQRGGTGGWSKKQKRSSQTD
jgi:hypothetical protein